MAIPKQFHIPKLNQRQLLLKEGVIRASAASEEIPNARRSYSATESAQRAVEARRAELRNNRKGI